MIGSLLSYRVANVIHTETFKKMDSKKYVKIIHELSKYVNFKDLPKYLKELILDAEKKEVNNILKRKTNK